MDGFCFFDLGAPVVKVPPAKQPAEGEPMPPSTTERAYYPTVASAFNVDWAALGVDVVVEATGQYRDRAMLERHLATGARRVILTVPPRDEVDAILRDARAREARAEAARCLAAHDEIDAILSDARARDAHDDEDDVPLPGYGSRTPADMRWA